MIRKKQFSYPAAPLDPLVKLFRSLYQLRILRKRKRERLPLKSRLPSRQNKLIEQAKRDWRGGYILTDDGDFVYVPKELDMTTIERLTRKPANEPIIARVCPPGGVVMDIGANLGDWGIEMVREVGPTGKLYAFEPIPYLAEAMRKTFRVNRYANAVVVQQAMSDSVGEATMNVFFDADEPLESLNVRKSSLDVKFDKGYQMKVPTTTLDAFCESEKLERLDFLKIDVETHEHAVIRGGLASIARFRPAIVIEAGHWEETREDRQRIHDSLAPLGYDVTGILIEHGIVESDWQAYLDLSDPFKEAYFCNVLCLPSEKTPAAKQGSAG